MRDIEGDPMANPDQGQSYEAELDQQRAVINEVDATLVPLFKRRAEAALEVGKIKARHGLPVYVGAREQEVIDKACDINGEDSIMPDQDITTLFRAVMKTSRAAQQRLTEKDDRVITGFRPTSDLTIGNYLGAVRPSLELQKDPSKDLYIFAADVHGLTDTDPREIAAYRHEVIKDLMAFGIDPQQSTVYMQSDIEDSVVEIANRVGPYITVNELARTPNLKEKMQTAMRKGTSETDEAGLSNFALFGYPVLMAADIYAQHAELVPVGEDQEPHLELARSIARRFNKNFGKGVLVEPKNLAVESLRILSLDGKGKMSKTNPNQAILLTDDPELASRKISKAMTAGAGEWNDAIESHFTVAKSTAQTEEQRHELEEIKKAHNSGQAVMKDFKTLWGSIIEQTLEDFQTAKAHINDADVLSALRYGADRAEKNALQTLSAMREAMGF
jgi:tryptophanyl-tRNA synthetase